MATFTIDLNGGDVETPESELYYKIYGSANGYTTAILTTGTATADPDVSVSSGVATITNVDVATETSFKVGVVDADGNESVLSDVYVYTPPSTGSTGTTKTPIDAPWDNNTSLAGLRSMSVTMYEAGTINSVSVYHVNAGGATKLQMGIYSDNAGAPGTLLGSTLEATSIIQGINTLNLQTPLPIAKGTKIWLASTAEVLQSYYKGNELAEKRSNPVSTAYVTLPSTFTTPSSYSDQSYYIYATYTYTPDFTGNLYTNTDAANPTNESNTVGAKWELDQAATIASDATNSVSGTGHSIKITASDDNLTGGYKLQFDVINAATYVLTFWAKTEAAAGNTVNTILYSNTNTNFGVGSTNIAIKSAQWTRYSVPITATASGVGKVYFKVSTLLSSLGNVLWLDDISIIQN